MQVGEGTNERKAKLQALKVLQNGGLISADDFTSTRNHILQRLRQGVPVVVSELCERSPLRY
jgi:hypothetical protein